MLDANKKQEAHIRNGSKDINFYKGRYTAAYYEKCAKMAKRHTDNYLSIKAIEMLIDLGKSQEVGVILHSEFRAVLTNDGRAQ